jgi:hypothetical protein
MPKPMLDSEVIKDLTTCTLTHSIELDDSRDVVRSTSSAVAASSGSCPAIPSNSPSGVANGEC